MTKEKIVIKKYYIPVKTINSIINCFQNVNPNYERLFKYKPQRNAVTRLVRKYGEQKVKDMVNVLSETNKRRYAPIITTPRQLEDKLGQLIIFINREKQNKYKIEI